MFVGLQGVETTDTCVEYARYHQKKGFRPALVCADTLGTDGSDSLKKASKDDVPVYKSDTLELAVQGIEKFKEEKHDLIIVDTRGHHKEYSALFDDMGQLAEAMKPDIVYFIINSSIGQAAFNQAQAFKQSFANGVVIVTNLKDNSKAGAALCAVAAAKCSMIFAETGDRINKFEAIDVDVLVSRLLHHTHFTLRKLYWEYQINLGLVTPIFRCPLPKVKSEAQAQLILKMMKLYMKIMDSMTDEELDRPDMIMRLTVERVREIAKGSEVEEIHVIEMLRAFKKMCKNWNDREERANKYRNGW